MLSMQDPELDVVMREWMEALDEFEYMPIQEVERDPETIISAVESIQE